MIDNKKEQERAELHRTIWNIANDLRGSVVGWYAVEVPQEWKQLEFEVKSDWLSNSKAKFVFNK